MAFVGPNRIWLFLIVFLLGMTSCTTTVDSIENYLDARDERAVAFCGCFGPLISYVNEDGAYSQREYEDCIAGEQLEVHQRSCITSMYTEASEFPPDIAFECLAAAESGYAEYPCTSKGLARGRRSLTSQRLP